MFEAEMSAHVYHYMPLHTKNQQPLSDVKFTLVSGTEIKKPARKVTQFNRGL
jgi:hypothetical protein